MKLYNSRTGRKETFTPRKGKQVNMFVCGITPYESAHIGNIKAALNYDLLARYLRFLGFRVDYLQNVTDIDDKIVQAARTKDISWRQVADAYFAEFLGVCGALHIQSVSRYAKATDHIADIIAQVKRLVAKGYAYEKNGSVYFEVAKFKEYGKLSGQNLAKLHRSIRLEQDTNKKHPYDFVLWKARGEMNEKYEPSWDSPWGKGRPGWHIEDTAISEHYFGPQYDLHGGAVELKFPHHEAEVAQQEAASGKKPFVKYWVHAGILMMGRQKMSKSLGNVITGKEMVQLHDPDIFRFLIVSTHYRSPIYYSEKLLTQAGTRLDRIREFVHDLERVSTAKGAAFSLTKYAKRFRSALDDDLNTPVALAALFTLMRDARKLMAKQKLSAKDARTIRSFFADAETIWGVPFEKKTEQIPERVTLLAKEREQARAAKDWTKADALRAAIEQEGYTVKDLKDGFEIVHK